MFIFFKETNYQNIYKVFACQMMLNIWAINRISQLVNCFEFKLLIIITFSSISFPFQNGLNCPGILWSVEVLCLAMRSVIDTLCTVRLTVTMFFLLLFPLLIMFTEITDDSQVEQHGGFYMCVKMLTFVLNYKYWTA